MSASPSDAATFYELVGGEETFHRIVHRFYEGVAGDPLLREMYPEDLDGSEWRLRSFLVQYWGGPHTYSEQRGHPRLRMRHAGFRIDSKARDAWLGHMRDALDEAALPPERDQQIWDYLVMAANSLINTLDEDDPRGGHRGPSLL